MRPFQIEFMVTHSLKKALNEPVICLLLKSFNRSVDDGVGTKKHDASEKRQIVSGNYSNCDVLTFAGQSF